MSRNNYIYKLIVNHLSLLLKYVIYPTLDQICANNDSFHLNKNCSLEKSTKGATDSI